MVSSIVSMALAMAVGSTGGIFGRHAPAPAGRILNPGPGYGYGFPNGNPDGYGWFDHGTALPLGANRTSEYFFPRYLSAPAEQLFLSTRTVEKHVERLLAKSGQPNRTSLGRHATRGTIARREMPSQKP